MMFRLDPLSGCARRSSATARPSAASRVFCGMPYKIMDCVAGVCLGRFFVIIVIRICTVFSKCLHIIFHQSPYLPGHLVSRPLDSVASFAHAFLRYRSWGGGAPDALKRTIQDHPRSISVIPVIIFFSSGRSFFGPKERDPLSVKSLAPRSGRICYGTAGGVVLYDLGTKQTEALTLLPAVEGKGKGKGSKGKGAKGKAAMGSAATGAPPLAFVQ